MTVLDTVTTSLGALTASAIALDEQHAAHNYSPLPVVAAIWIAWPHIPQ